MTTDPALSKSDLAILQSLARRKAELARHPENRARKAEWLRHGSGKPGRPMLLAEHGGIRDARSPVSDAVLQCENPWARGIERGFRHDFYVFDTLKDDHVIEPWLQTNWMISATD